MARLVMVAGILVLTAVLLNEARLWPGARARSSGFGVTGREIVSR